LKVVSQHLLGDTEKNHEKFGRDSQDLNITTEHYCCNSLLRVKTALFWDVTSGSLVESIIQKVEAHLLLKHW
jgi:hypothetical protein